MRTLILAAALFSATSALGSDGIYGNVSGCSPENATDDLVRLSPTVIELWEGECTSPVAFDYSGKPNAVTCVSEGEEWQSTISLKRERDDSVIYKDENRTVTLYRCPE